MRLFIEMRGRGTEEFDWTPETWRQLRIRKAWVKWLENGEKMDTFFRGGQAKFYLVGRPELIICPMCGGKGQIDKKSKSKPRKVNNA